MFQRLEAALLRLPERGKLARQRGEAAQPLAVSVKP